jgi:hypothetical protein
VTDHAFSHAEDEAGGFVKGGEVAKRQNSKLAKMGNRWRLVYFANLPFCHITFLPPYRFIHNQLIFVHLLKVDNKVFIYLFESYTFAET